MRNSRGSVLSLVIGCTLVVVMIGVAILILINIMSGSRQVNSAIDAGSLNVATLAVIQPSVPLDQNDPLESQLQLVIGKGKNVNLLNINKVILWGLQVAINADADGSPGGLQEAKDYLKKIQGDSQNSICARLKKVLCDPNTPVSLGSGAAAQSGPWVPTYFNSVALKNTTLLANPDDRISWDISKFGTGYLGAGDSTNVKFDSALAKFLPFKDLSTLTRYKIAIPATGDGYIKGYVPIEVPNVGTFYFVTVYHDQNPGLRSLSEYSKNKSQPGEGVVALPPNTFFNSAAVIETKSHKEFIYGAPACAGTKPYNDVVIATEPPTPTPEPPPPTPITEPPTPTTEPPPTTTEPPPTTTEPPPTTTEPPRLPWTPPPRPPYRPPYQPYVPYVPPPNLSYLILANMPGVTYSGIGPPLGCDTVLCDELGQGLFVLQNTAGTGLVFSTSLTDVELLKTWLKQTQPGPAPALSTELYYYSNGTSVTDLIKLKASMTHATAPHGTSSITPTPGQGVGSVLTCTEHNSDWAGPGQNACCVRGLGPFNRAFHPNPRAFPRINVDGLMAVEYEKNLINQLFDDQNTRTLNKWNSARGTNFTTYQQLLNYLYSPAFNQDWASIHELFNVGSSSINAEPPILSGLRLYPTGRNPYAYANIPWGTKGVYTPGIDQWGQVDCCSKTGYVDPHRIGKVTSASTPGLLINQITASTSSPYYYEVWETPGVGHIEQGYLRTAIPEVPPTKAIYNYFRQRCQQMKATQTDIDSVWQNTKLEVGDTWYVYVDPESKKLTANKTLPAAFGSSSGLPALPVPPKVVTLFNKYLYKYVATSDRSSQRVIKSAEFIKFDGWPGGLGGNTCLYAHPYEPLSGIINSRFDFNIHNRTFLAYGDNPMIQGHNYAQDNVILEEANGGLIAKGCVGRISFSQNAYNIGGPVPFVAPD